MHPVDAHTFEFYERVAARFSQTRRHPWRGWSEIRLPARPTVRILDAGCGNGRLYAHLRDRYSGRLTYIGADFSPALLAEAKSLAGAVRRPGDVVEFRKLDLHRLSDSPPPPNERFDRICLFGVLHHVAERERRERLLRALGAHLTDGGELWVTAWRFTEDPSYAPPPAEGPTAFPVSEPGARWLSFDGGGQRYCVSVPLVEIEGYPAACGLLERRRFRADGRTGTMNQYLVYTRLT